MGEITSAIIHERKTRRRNKEVRFARIARRASSAVHFHLSVVEQTFTRILETSETLVNKRALKYPYSVALRTRKVPDTFTASFRSFDGLFRRVSSRLDKRTKCLFLKYFLPVFLPLGTNGSNTYDMSASYIHSGLVLRTWQFRNCVNFQRSLDKSKLLRIICRRSTLSPTGHSVCFFRSTPEKRHNRREKRTFDSCHRL